MEWDADFYKKRHFFVSEYGKDLMRFLPRKEPLFILDLGCGTGTLSNELAQKGHQVIGIDASASMIDMARRGYPEIEFKRMDACEMPWEHVFDVVFSNAVFHWITDQKRLLAQVFQVLKRNGKLICEFGAYGNIRKIQKAFQRAMQAKGYSYENLFFYPTAKQYRAMLEEAGFVVEHLIVYPRPTPLDGGKDGLKNWISQFLSSSLAEVPIQEREEILQETERLLLPELWDGRQWVADYKRLQAVAQKK